MRNLKLLRCTPVVKLVETSGTQCLSVDVDSGTVYVATASNVVGFDPSTQQVSVSPRLLLKLTLYKLCHTRKKILLVLINFYDKFIIYDYYNCYYNSSCYHSTLMSFSSVTSSSWTKCVILTSPLKWGSYINLCYVSKVTRGIHCLTAIKRYFKRFINLYFCNTWSPNTKLVKNFHFSRALKIIAVIQHNLRFRF